MWPTFFAAVLALHFFNFHVATASIVRKSSLATIIPCMPSVTQVVQNPSFEDNADGTPWSFRGSTALVTGNSDEEFGGNKFVRIHLSNPKASGSISQQLTDLDIGSDYFLRFFWRIPIPGHVDPNYMCFFRSYLGDGYTATPSSFETRNMDAQSAGHWQFAESIIRPTTPSERLNITFGGCFTHSFRRSMEAEILIDQITLTKRATNCEFVLEVVNSNKTIDRQYVFVNDDVPLRHLTTGARFQASNFSIDPYMNLNRMYTYLQNGSAKKKAPVTFYLDANAQPASQPGMDVVYPTFMDNNQNVTNPRQAVNCTVTSSSTLAVTFHTANSFVYCGYPLPQPMSCQKNGYGTGIMIANAAHVDPKKQQCCHPISLKVQYI